MPNSCGGQQELKSRQQVLQASTRASSSSSSVAASVHGNRQACRRLRGEARNRPPCRMDPAAAAAAMLAAVQQQLRQARWTHCPRRIEAKEGPANHRAVTWSSLGLTNQSLGRRQPRSPVPARTTARQRVGVLQQVLPVLRERCGSSRLPRQVDLHHLRGRQ